MDMEFEQNNDLEKEYLEHSVFQQIKELIKFYDTLSHTTMGFISQGTKAILNLDTYVFSSMSGTLESIHNVLHRGRINDAYALLRKYYDSTIINIYTNLYLNDHFSFEILSLKRLTTGEAAKKDSQSIVRFQNILKTQRC